jgi:tRNA threonylcarbamoyladenosine biosynthesis protein TsaE
VRESHSKILNLPGAQRMREFGQSIGQRLLAIAGQPVVIYLQGDLGAGKTTLVGGILNAAGVPGPVRSPTYTLIEPYDTTTKYFYHLDLYRLVDPLEVEPLGLRDLLIEDAVLLIEWPERGVGMLPVADVLVDIEYGDQPDSRALRVSAGTDVGEGLVHRLSESSR